MNGLSQPTAQIRGVLTIDGGGIRGINPALVVAHLERTAKKPASELFDLIAGTSTGGMLALGLSLEGDGGVFMNSPLVSAYAEARKLFPDEPIVPLSLGTGDLTRPIPYEEARTWGRDLWVMSLLDCMFDGASKAADYQMRQFLGGNYLWLQTPQHFASDDIDDASKGNIRNLTQTTRELIATEGGALHRFLAHGQSVIADD